MQLRAGVKMPPVDTCTVTECAYNRDSKCCTFAITVGDSEHPMCDTYFQASSHTQTKSKAGVGACKVAVCEYNKDFECQAKAIMVGRGDCAADCLTFERK